MKRDKSPGEQRVCKIILDFGNTGCQCKEASETGIRFCENGNHDNDDKMSRQMSDNVWLVYDSVIMMTKVLLQACRARRG